MSNAVIYQRDVIRSVVVGHMTVALVHRLLHSHPRLVTMYLLFHLINMLYVQGYVHYEGAT